MLRMPRTRRVTKSFNRLLFFFEMLFFRLSWETSAFNNCHSEDSRYSGSRRIEFSSKGAASLQ